MMRFFGQEKSPIKIELKESELEWSFVRGGGKGGQKTNKTTNCVVLRHKPTNTVVKCHKSRSLETNKNFAKKRLKQQLDMLFNKEHSKKAIKDNKVRKNKNRRKRRSQLKHNKTKNISDKNPKIE
jgi:protein subunit release factor B